MSFILDALRKLEEQRKREEVPDITTVHEGHGTAGKKRSPWPYLLLAALLINAALLGAWRISRDTSMREPSVVAHRNIEAGTEDISPSVEKDPVSPLEKKSSQSESPLKEKPLENPSSQILDEVRAVTPPGTVLTEESETTGKGQTALPPDDMGETRADLAEGDSGRIPDIKELSPSFKENLPDIKISGHVYFDTPEDRLVIINGKSAREGETVVSGLQVEEITASGVVFTYEDRRFSMPGY
jgi:hypothetical protein